MKKLLIPILAGILAFTACSKDDSKPSNNNNSNSNNNNNNNNNNTPPDTIKSVKFTVTNSSSVSTSFELKSVAALKTQSGPDEYLELIARLNTGPSSVPYLNIKIKKAAPWAPGLKYTFSDNDK